MHVILFFFNWNTFKKCFFKKTKSRLDQKLCQFSLFQHEKDCSWTKNCKLFIQYLEEGVKRGSSLTSFSQILQSSSKAIYRDQTTTGSFKFGTMYIFEVKNLTFRRFSKIWKLWRHKVKIGPKRSQICILYSNCNKKIKFNNYGFFEVSNSFFRPVF